MFLSGPEGGKGPMISLYEMLQEQKPIFFVSKVMDETELRYLPLEKAALALL